MIRAKASQWVYLHQQGLALVKRVNPKPHKGSEPSRGGRSPNLSQRRSNAKAYAGSVAVVPIFSGVPNQGRVLMGWDETCAHARAAQ